MIDIVKKSILFGLGTYELTKEKLDAFMKRMEKEEKITPEEGKKVAEQVWGDVEKHGKSAAKDLTEAVRKVVAELGLATKKDIEDLKKEIKK